MERDENTLKKATQNQIETPADLQSFKMYLLFYSGQLLSLIGSSAVSFTIAWWVTLGMGEEASVFFFSHKHVS